VSSLKARQTGADVTFIKIL